MNEEFKKGDRVTVQTIFGPIGAVILEVHTLGVTVLLDPNSQGLWYQGEHVFPLFQIKKEDLND